MAGEDLLEELDLGPRAPRSDNVVEMPTVEGQVGASPLRIKGPPPSSGPLVQYERDLTQADLEALCLPRGVKPRSITRIHASHHSLARCLAVGMKQGQAALVTGYSQVRISQLVHDPAFMALVEDYRSEMKSFAADMTERLTNMTLDAIELLHEKMLDRPEEMTVSVLIDTIKMGADRVGHGPGQKLNVNVSHDFIDRPPRETYEEWEKRRMIEINPKDLNS